MDMSLFQTRKNDSWAKRGVTVATDNLSYFVDQRPEVTSMQASERASERAPLHPYIQPHQHI